MESRLRNRADKIFVPVLKYPVFVINAKLKELLKQPRAKRGENRSFRLSPDDMKKHSFCIQRNTGYSSTLSHSAPLSAGVLLSSCVLIAASAWAETVRVPSLPGTTVTVTTRSSQAAAAAASPEALDLPVVAEAINVLVLALDDSDIKSARSVGITRMPAKPAPAQNTPAPALEPAVTDLPLMTEPEDEAAPPAMLLPPPPAAKQRVPANEMAVPGMGPATFRKNQSFVEPTWRALAQQQLGGIPPMSPPPRRRPAAASDSSIPNLPSVVVTEDMAASSSRPPGRAQIAAAPLRRALNAQGLRDVLTTPLDGPTIVRSVIAGRLNSRVLDSLRFSTGQMIESLNNSSNPAVPSPLFAAARQKAIQAASRIGLSMGYRAVVVLALTNKGEYSYLLVDTTQETGETFIVPAAGDTPVARDQNAAGSAAGTLSARLTKWTPFTADERAQRIESHMDRAQAAIAGNDLTAAQDQLGQIVALDPSYTDAYILLGDVLQNSDPIAAGKAYQRAAEINTRNGAVWSKIALVHTLSNPPDWVRSLSAANRALQLGFDSANLRTAMAAAEFGRADLLRRGGRPDQAENTELIAHRHLDRARELAPDDPEVTAGISRLMAKYLLDQKRYKEAVQSLDLLAIQYADDLPTQTMYAQALEGQGTRLEDLFLAWARVWKISGESEVLLDSTRYARIADGFDQRMVNISKNVFQMTSGVATGALSRETAILQTNRSMADLNETLAAIRLIRPPMGRTSSDAHVARLFAADLMQQAMEFYSQFLETGQEISRSRAVDLHRQAIESLNNARAVSAS